MIIDRMFCTENLSMLVQHFVLVTLCALDVTRIQIMKRTEFVA